jgi:hypothetical protein
LSVGLLLVTASPISAQDASESGDRLQRRIQIRDQTGAEPERRDRRRREASEDRDASSPRSGREQRQRAESDDDRARRRGREFNAGTEDGRPEPQLVRPRDGRWPWRPPRAPSWRLGVYANNTNTGVRVTRVVPRSPAWQAGLETGDRIVTVDGYQVGYVNGRLYSLGEELDRQAGPRGQVTLLVQNRRNARLINVEVDLERRGW